MLDVGQLNKTIFLLSDPTSWACRYSDRPTLSTPLFVEIGAVNNMGKGRLIDIKGGVDPDWTELDKLDIDKSNLPPFPDEALMKSILEHLERQEFAPAMSTLLATMALKSDEWDDLCEQVENTRYSVSAWFERDNREVTLTDDLSGQDVCTLKGEDLDSEIESGYLTPPRRPRPSESDWLEPMLDFARARGLIQSPSDLQATARAAMRAQPNPARVTQ